MSKLKIILVLITIGVLWNTYCLDTYKNQDSILLSYQNQLKSLDDSSKKADLILQIAQRYEILNKEDLAFKNFKKALKLYTNLKVDNKAMDCNLAIFSLLNSQNNIDIPALPYLDKYYIYAKKTNNDTKQFKALMCYASYNFNSEGYEKSKSYYEDAYKFAVTLKDTVNQANIFCNLGLLHSGYIDQDSARIHFKNALKLYNDENEYEKFIIYINYANSYQKEKNYNKAITYLKLAEEITPKKHKLNLQKILYGKFANCYQELNQFKEAFTYLDSYNTVKDSINITNQNIAISKIKEQYDNEKLRAKNAESETKRLKSEADARKKQNIVYGLAGSLALGSIIAFLLFKNTRKKQLLAEQQKELETQKLATVLKEQELTSIDAMIEGQEKERQRIANDLHDDLGGLMATVKLHFNALKEKQTPELYTKTNALIDEAYHKVRTVAHAKNSGVIAKQGLLKAIHEMATKISALNKITIDVIDHGLENRLENSLELTIFRIIQELITNVIKHANATEVTIHITNHEDSLNIMVEDNGKGFNPSQVTKTNKGMGISSIDKRVEHLNGTMTIESENNQGTTIIIDLPI